MFGTKKNFGLPDSLIAAVTEAMKVKKEDDANLAKVNDIADNLKGMTTSKAGKLPNTDAGGPDMFKSNAPSIVKKEELKGNQHKIDKNKNGKVDAHDFKLLRKEEVEELDELSKGTLGSYVKKASSDMAVKLRSGSEFDNKASAIEKQTNRGNMNNYASGREAEKNRDKAYGGYLKRKRGITKAVDKLTKEEVQFSEEEIARISEIAKGL
jgi:hypothetical protein